MLCSVKENLGVQFVWSEYKPVACDVTPALIPPHFENPPSESTNARHNKTQQIRTITAVSFLTRLRWSRGVRDVTPKHTAAVRRVGPMHGRHRCERLDSKHALTAVSSATPNVAFEIRRQARARSLCHRCPNHCLTCVCVWWYSPSRATVNLLQ